MPRFSAICLILAAAIVGGCAAVQDMAGIPRSGYQQDGTYVVGPEQENLACRQIKDRLNVLDSKLKALPAKAAAEKEVGPKTLGSALSRMFGAPGDGLKATSEMQRVNAETTALNALLVKKQCV